MLWFSIVVVKNLKLDLSLGQFNLEKGKHILLLLLLLLLKVAGNVTVRHYYIISGALASAKRARSGAPWVRKFGFDVAYARPLSFSLKAHNYYPAYHIGPDFSN